VDAVLIAEAPPLDGSVVDPIWRRASHVTLDWNVDFTRPAENRTDTYFVFDDRFMYVTFLAHQREPVAATRKTETTAGNESDDFVAVYLWPSGVNGFRYEFSSNPLGTRSQESTENSAFAPQWTALGRKSRDGYTVAMRIPLDVMRGDGRSTWRLQFSRGVIATSELNEWAYAPQQQNERQAVFAGYLRGMSFAAQRTRAKTRIGVYALSRQTGSATGSLAGFDFAVPVTQTASMVGTVHPDYSNVELDQQTITPTEFPRILQEVRPFFTQGASFYNQFTVIGDPGNTMLYTPSIPTPRFGYALEGNQAQFGLGAFSAVGAGREDDAQSLTWANESQILSAAVQRVSVSAGALRDSVVGGTLKIDNHRTAYAYLDIAADRGTNVLDTGRGTWLEVGAAYSRPTTLLGVALRQIGEFYAPADGVVAHPDIAGYAVQGSQQYNFPTSSRLLTAGFNGTLDRYHDSTGRLDQADQSAQLELTSRQQLRLTLTSGSHFLVLPDGTSGFFDQGGVSFGYRDATTTPTDITYDGGRFGPGFLHTLQLSTVNTIGPGLTLSLENDRTAYDPDRTPRMTQWLGRASLAWQIDKSSSLSVGARRILGSAPAVGAPPTNFNASNVSAAYHKSSRRTELYLVYGDPSAVSTVPTLTLKVIYYIGAQKGT
jgi:hypothetical protein